MKIGFVVDDTLDKPDGVQQYVLTLGAWLSAQGHSVHYLCGETRRTDIKHVHSLTKNSHVRFNGNRMSIPRPANAQKIRKLLEQEQFDVLHIQMPYSPMLAGKIIKYAAPQTAVFGTFHIVPLTWRERVASRLLGWYEHGGLKRFDTVVSVSQPAAHFARSAFGLKTNVLPNVVDLHMMQAGAPPVRFNDGKFNIMFLGRLVERKGSLQLLKAIEQLHSEHLLTNVRVVIGGKGPLEVQLHEYVQSHHLGSVVQLSGFVNEADKNDYLASADIAAFPSTGGESFGIVLIEAMAAGATVVIGGNNSGYRSVLGERPDQLVTPDDTAQFARILKHFISSSQARKSAVSWQKRAVKQYDVQTVGPQLVEYYQSAIAKRRA